VFVVYHPRVVTVVEIVARLLAPIHLSEGSVRTCSVESHDVLHCKTVDVFIVAQQMESIF
jgi:hypothetical protein